jgi:hypothetical protein
MERQNVFARRCRLQWDARTLFRVVAGCNEAPESFPMSLQAAIGRIAQAGAQN